MFGHEYQDSRAVSLRLTDAQERQMYRQLAAWKRAGRALMFAAASYDRTARWPDFTVLATSGPAPSACMAGKFYVHIDANGDVHPCGLHTGTFSQEHRPRRLRRRHAAHPPPRLRRLQPGLPERAQGGLRTAAGRAARSRPPFVTGRDVEA